jgi:peptide/nickel transport system permease protein
MSEPQSPILTLEQLSVRLPAGADRPHALSGVSLSVAASEILCVVGESGSGKSIMANAIMRLLPMVTLIGLQAGTMLGGSVVVESVFSLPGLGRLAYEAVVQRDLNTLLGIVFVSALLVIAVNFLVDLIYARLDPRISGEV